MQPRIYFPHSKKVDSSIENTQILADLFDAILKVSDKYMHDNNAEDDAQGNYLERVFAYELYHRWSNIIYRRKCEYKRKGLDKYPYILSGETGKDMARYLTEVRDNNGHKFPDLVLHGDLSGHEHQGIVVEIKRKEGLKGKNKFYDDISKLCDFVCCANKDYMFQFGVFLLENSKFAKIEEEFTKVRSEIKTLCGTRSDRIFLVAYTINDGKDLLQFLDLKSMLE